MRIERAGRVTGVRIVDRVPVRGRIGEPSSRITGWTTGRTIASVSVDGFDQDFEIEIAEEDQGELLRRLPDLRVYVTIEVTS
jgi:hypothetical protein